MKPLILLPVLAWLCFTLCSCAEAEPQKTTTPQQQSASQQQPSTEQGKGAGGESKTWRVVVVSAEKYTLALPDIDQYGPPADEFNLVLKLAIEYVGPDADISAPEVAVVDDKGKEYRMRGTVEMAVADSADMKVVGWLLSATHRQPDNLPLKTGQKVGPKSPVTYYFAGIPKDSQEIKLRFGDVPAFTIRLTQMKEK